MQGCSSSDRDCLHTARLLCWEESTSCCSLGSAAALHARALLVPRQVCGWYQEQLTYEPLLPQPGSAHCSCDGHRGFIAEHQTETAEQPLSVTGEAGAPSAPSPPSLRSQRHSLLPGLHPHLPLPPPPPPPIKGFTNAPTPTLLLLSHHSPVGT